MEVLFFCFSFIILTSLLSSCGAEKFKPAQTSAVCGIDDLEHTECEAREYKIEIVKYILCSAKGL